MGELSDSRPQLSAVMGMQACRQNCFPRLPLHRIWKATLCIFPLAEVMPWGQCCLGGLACSIYNSCCLRQSTSLLIVSIVSIAASRWRGPRGFQGLGLVHASWLVGESLQIAFGRGSQ